MKAVEAAFATGTKLSFTCAAKMVGQASLPSCFATSLQASRVAEAAFLCLPLQAEGR